MLGATETARSLPRILFQVVATVLFLVLSGAAFVANRDSVFLAGNVYYADGDCYARMTRVRMMEESPLSPIRHHVFENFPEGTRPHTTVPLDALIFLLHALIKPLTPNSLAVAGAFISPLIGVFALAFLAIWSGAERIPFRWAFLVLFALSPITVHAFELGRPDHQSLVLALVAAGIAAEISLWRRGSQPWAYASAVIWGLALWVSLFEPLIVLVCVLAARGMRRILAGPSRRSILPARWGPLVVFASILAVAIAWDGLPRIAFDHAFERWTRPIGEMRSVSPSILFAWGGWMAALAPVLLLLGFVKRREPLLLLWNIAIAVSAGLTLSHLRWGYFFVLFLSFSLPWALTYFRSGAFAGLVFVISLWPVAEQWDGMLFPSNESYRERVEKLADDVALRDAALQLKRTTGGGVMAPWWFSPAVVWWSGIPAVAGSSHQSLPGILDTERVYLSTDADEVKRILRARRVEYVIAYDLDRTEENAAETLGVPVPARSFVRLIWRHPGALPDYLEPYYGNRFFRVLRVKGEAG